MTFPASPANGDLYQINGYTFTYVSTQNQWVGTMPTSGAVSSGSVFTPTNSFGLMLDVGLSTVAHQGGTVHHHIAYRNPEDLLLVKDYDFSADSSSLDTYTAAGNFGTDVETLGQYQTVDPALPRFDTVEEFLASSPSYDQNGTATFFSDANNSYFYTADSGANFQEFPRPFVGTGSVKVTKAGKYRIRIKESSVVRNTTSGAAVQGVSGLLKNDTIISLEYFKAKYEPTSSNDNAFTCDLDYSALIDAAVDDEISIALPKYGGNAYSNHLIDMTIESLF